HGSRLVSGGPVGPRASICGSCGTEETSRMVFRARHGSAGRPVVRPGPAHEGAGGPAAGPGRVVGTLSDALAGSAPVGRLGNEGLDRLVSVLAVFVGCPGR